MSMIAIDRRAIDFLEIIRETQTLAVNAFLCEDQYSLAAPIIRIHTPTAIRDKRLEKIFLERTPNSPSTRDAGAPLAPMAREPPL